MTANTMALIPAWINLGLLVITLCLLSYILATLQTMVGVMRDVRNVMLEAIARADALAEVERRRKAAPQP